MNKKLNMDFTRAWERSKRKQVIEFPKESIQKEDSKTRNMAWITTWILLASSVVWAFVATHSELTQLAGIMAIVMFLAGIISINCIWFKDMKND